MCFQQFEKFICTFHELFWHFKRFSLLDWRKFSHFKNFLVYYWRIMFSKKLLFFECPIFNFWCEFWNYMKIEELFRLYSWVFYVTANKLFTKVVELYLLCILSLEKSRSIYTKSLTFNFFCRFFFFFWTVDSYLAVKRKRMRT